MAFSSDGRGPFRAFPTPNDQVDWLGFRSSAWELQRAGWSFEEIRDYDYNHRFRDVKTVAMRHPTGMAALAECPERDVMRAIDSCFRRDDDEGPIFSVVRVSDRADKINVVRHTQWTHHRLNMEPMVHDMESKFYECRLSDLFPEKRDEEEIIVEPATVQSLLAQIKSMQAPELAAIRENNRRREARERLPEIRHATILSFGT